MEVHFQLRHFLVSNSNYDSYNGSVVQVIVLRPAEAEAISEYQEECTLEGPIRKKPSLGSRKKAQTEDARDPDTEASKTLKEGESDENVADVPSGDARDSHRDDDKLPEGCFVTGS